MTVLLFPRRWMLWAKYKFFPLCPIAYCPVLLDLKSINQFLSFVALFGLLSLYALQYATDR